jgi:Tfp pilus assembly protein PilE
MSMQKGFTLIELIRLVHALKIVKLLLLLRSSFYRLVQIELNEENI